MSREALAVRTWRLQEPIDLVRFAGPDGYLFARGGAGVAGRGEATRISRTDALADLRSIASDDTVKVPGSGAVAFAALPFEPGAPCRLVVPAVTVGSNGRGDHWVTVVGAPDELPEPPDLDLAPTDMADRAVNGPTGFDVRASRPPQEWCKAVDAATAAIRVGRLDKVVLAREIVVTADREIQVDAVLGRLARTYPGCYLYLVDGFCGASPELLVSRSGDVVTAQPMAGTAPRQGSAEADEEAAAALLASPTYRHEHQVTIDAVHDTLLRFSSYVDYEPEPSVVPLANVVHLATSVEGRLSHPPASVLDLVDALHPTPAVCGRPRENALALISELEDLDRRNYAGAVGWVDAEGNGEFAVAIRGAEISGRTARVIAGNGIVADSDPATELAETRAKLQAMLSAIVRP